MVFFIEGEKLKAKVTVTVHIELLIQVQTVNPTKREKGQKTLLVSSGPLISQTTLT